VNRNEFTFGFGTRGTTWLRLTRDLATDLKKGLAAGKSSRRPRRASMRLAALRLRGEGLVANVSLAEEEHLRMFFHAADWFLENQVRYDTSWLFFLCSGFLWYRTVSRYFLSLRKCHDWNIFWSFVKKIFIIFKKR
jgi:hypothetical protein